MIRVLRRLQRKSIRSAAYESLSYLLMPGDNEFEPFGLLTCCLETAQARGCQVRRGPFSDTLMITALVEGRMTVGEGGPVLEAGQVAATRTADGELISYFSDPVLGARYFEIGLQETGCQPGVDLIAGGLRRDLPNPVFIPLASGRDAESPLAMEIDSTLYWGRLRAGETVIFETAMARKTFLLLLRGTVRVVEERLLSRDCAFIEQEFSIPLASRELTEFLLLDLP